MATLTEFFRPVSLRPVDDEGYELPEWENPYFAIPPEDEPYEPSPEDLQDYLEWSDRLAALHDLAGHDEPDGRITDADLIAAGLPVG